METVLRAAVTESLNAYIYSNALFLAERLWSEFRTLQNLHLLAHCHVAAGDPETAYLLLTAHHLTFGEIRASTAAEPTPALRTERAIISRRPMPTKITPKTPLWDCVYLHAITAIQTLRFVEAEAALRQLGADSAGTVSYWTGIVAQRLNRPAVNDTIPPSDNFIVAVKSNPMLFVAYERCARFYNQAPDALYEQAATAETSTTTASASVAEAPVRSKVPPKKASVTVDPPSEALTRGRLDALRLLSFFAKATRLLHSYQCTALVDLLTSAAAMPQSASGWALEHLGLAYFHNGELPKASDAFSAMLNKEPWRLNTESIVSFSTTLWHLKQDVRLGALAQRMIRSFPKSAYTLCVVGNSHSLGKDSESALLFFTRAARVSPPDFAYVHTLRAHEALALDQEVVAENAFRTAIAIDQRHYQAIAGLAEVLLRVDDVGRARRQLRLALDINTLPTIMNRFAATYHRPGSQTSEADLREALRLYELALKRHPHNIAAAHQRATVLLRLGFAQDAKVELERLVTECGGEAAVHLTLGHCYAQQGDVIRAVASYRRAVELDPRRAPFATGCIDKLTAAAAQPARAA